MNGGNAAAPSRTSPRTVGTVPDTVASSSTAVGVGVTVGVGVGVTIASIRNVRVAGVASTVPAAFLARTKNV